MAKERAIELQLIKPITPGSPGSKGKITLKNLFKDVFKQLNVGYSDPCCDDSNPGVCPPISEEEGNIIQCLNGALYATSSGSEVTAINGVHIDDDGNVALGGDLDIPTTINFTESDSEIIIVYNANVPAFNEAVHINNLGLSLEGEHPSPFWTPLRVRNNESMGGAFISAANDLGEALNIGIFGSGVGADASVAAILTNGQNSVLRIGNTYSGSGGAHTEFTLTDILVMDLDQFGLHLLAGIGLYAPGSITGGGSYWTFGKAEAGTASLDTTQYITVNLDGTDYNLALATVV